MYTLIVDGFKVQIERNFDASLSIFFENDLNTAEVWVNMFGQLSHVGTDTDLDSELINFIPEEEELSNIIQELRSKKFII